jgi:transmembrane sensor
MEKNLDIKKLLEKFRHDDLTSDELQNLYTLLTKPNHPDMISLIDEEWDKASNVQDEFDSGQLLHHIHQKANIGQQNKEGKGRLFSFTHLLKYAAVFIVAFGLAWLLKPSSSVSSVQEKPSFFTIKVAYGSKSTVELPDSSLVVLNSGSTLTYPDRFEKNSRTVSLSGEGFFEVKKNPLKPFYVKTNGITVKVLGTKFNLKSYPDENIIETTLVTGSVEILENEGTAGKKERKHPSVVLKPNQKAVFTKNAQLTQVENPAGQDNVNQLSGQITPETLIHTIAVEEKVKTELYTAWKNNLLIFSNESFAEIIKRLERWYNVEITLKNESLSRTHFSAKFDRESITDVLNALQMIQPFKYEMDKNKIIIK